MVQLYRGNKDRIKRKVVSVAFQRRYLELKLKFPVILVDPITLRREYVSWRAGHKRPISKQSTKRRKYRSRPSILKPHPAS